MLVWTKPKHDNIRRIKHKKILLSTKTRALDSSGLSSEEGTGITDFSSATSFGASGTGTGTGTGSAAGGAVSDSTVLGCSSVIFLLRNSEFCAHRSGKQKQVQLHFPLFRKNQHLLERERKLRRVLIGWDIIVGGR